MIKTEGEALIQATTGEKFKISPDELDWEGLGGDERGMGQETLYIAEVEHSLRDGGIVRCRWEASEYPVGVLNHVTHSVQNGLLVEDFEFTWEHHPEVDD